MLEEQCQPKCLKEKWFFDECTKRVNETKSNEICSQELYDLATCIDNCVAKDLFKHLK